MSIKTKLSDKPYQWQNGDAWGVGRLVIAVDDEPDVRVISPVFGCFLFGEIDSDDVVLVSHSHTGELEFVEWGKLSPYPASPIPEPTNTGRTY